MLLSVFYGNLCYYILNISSTLFANHLFSNSGNDGFWVGKASLRQWKQLAIAAQNFDVNEDENNEVDGVKPLEQNLDLQNRKEDLSNIEDKGKTVQSECSENTQSKSHDNGHGAPHGEQIKPQDDGENGVKISKLENEEANLDESMEENNASNKIKENVFNADAQCQEHGTYIFAKRRRSEFRTFLILWLRIYLVNYR